MRYRNFAELIAAAKDQKKRLPFAVVCAGEDHTIKAVLRSCDDGLIAPVLIGNKPTIERLLIENGKHPGDFSVIQMEEPEAAAQYAVDMVNAGEIRGIMKGLLETSQFMRVLLKSANRLRVSPIVCSMSLMEVPHYHKLIAGSDPGICICPTLEEKVQIINNCVAALTNMGIEQPKVGVLAAVETVNPKMPETIEAEALKQMNLRGEIPGCIVDGPLSYDLCMDPEAATIKGVAGAVAGDPDLILYPNLVVGNAVSKALVISARAVGSSLILGTAVPVVLSSRSASIDEKYRNLLLAVFSSGFHS